MKNLFIIITLTFLAFNLHSKEIIIADISQDKIDIDVGFKGAKLLFFGVIDDKGDVVVSVTGPRKTIRVRKKEKSFGIWINSVSKLFYDVPTYYFVASSRELKNLDADQALKVNQIGIKNLRFEGTEAMEQNEKKYWKSGIIETMIKKKRYFPSLGEIKISDNTLFKTELSFSSELIEGTYLVDTLLLKKGNVIAARRSFINVSKSGYGEKIHRMAKENSLIYGILAVFFALIFGFLVHETIRKVNA